MFVCCMCCVLSGRGLCDRPITRPEESYRLWCVTECDLEKTARSARLKLTVGCNASKRRRSRRLWKLVSLLISKTFAYLFLNLTPCMLWIVIIRK
jgi:hypothetical protein